MNNIVFYVNDNMFCHKITITCYVFIPVDTYKHNLKVIQHFLETDAPVCNSVVTLSAKVFSYLLLFTRSWRGGTVQDRRGERAGESDPPPQCNYMNNRREEGSEWAVSLCHQSVKCKVIPAGLVV